MYDDEQFLRIFFLFLHLFRGRLCGRENICPNLYVCFTKTPLIKSDDSIPQRLRFV